MASIRWKPKYTVLPTSPEVKKVIQQFRNGRVYCWNKKNVPILNVLNVNIIYNGGSPSSNFPSILNGGSPSSNFPKILNGGSLPPVFNGGSPSSSFSSILNGGFPSSNFSKILNGEKPTSI